MWMNPVHDIKPCDIGSKPKEKVQMTKDLKSKDPHVIRSNCFLVYNFFTARVRSTTGGYIFTLSVCSPPGEGVPNLHSIKRPLVPCPFWGEVPQCLVRGPRQGVPLSQAAGAPVQYQDQADGTLARTGMGTLQPGQAMLGQVTPRAAPSCGLPQEDCLV